MLFFGLLGACNAVMFGPLVLLLGWSHLGTLTPDIGFIIVMKGEPKALSPNCLQIIDRQPLNTGR